MEVNSTLPLKKVERAQKNVHTENRFNSGGLRLRSLLGRFRRKPIDVTPSEDAAAPDTSGTIEQDRGDTIKTVQEVAIVDLQDGEEVERSMGKEEIVEEVDSMNPFATEPVDCRTRRISFQLVLWLKGKTLQLLLKSTYQSEKSS